MSTRQKAIQWIRSNFKVVEMFETFAMQLSDRNRCFGINLLRERVRWECVYEYGADEYKFPNELSPYVARFLLWLHPELKGKMECKITKDEISGKIELIEAGHIWPEHFEVGMDPKEFPKEGG